jgi:hypothetical protein
MLTPTLPGRPFIAGHTIDVVVLFLQEIRYV